MEPTVQIARFVTGPLDTNTYVVADDRGRALIVDPSSGCTEVVNHCVERRLRIGGIVLTHGHFDHLLGLDEVRKHFTVDVWVHPDEKALIRQPGLNGSDMLGISFYYDGPLQELHEGDMEIGGLSLAVLHVPGHSPGGCALLFGNQLIAGDALFAGSVGRADLPGGDFELLIRSIRDKLMVLPPDTVVWPGHGNRTTIGREKRLNPFVGG
jgi:hydroxyacylglutathione hydrolase